MKKLILENRWKLVISTLLILCPQLAASFLGETIYWLPFQCLVLHWFCLLITFHDWSRRPQGKRIVSLVIWMVPAISIMGSGLVLIVKTGQISSAIIPYLMYVGFGLMFLVVGNYFPKIRQNHTMGIKVKWALEDEENWNATHRFGGKVWAACGFFCLLLVLFPPDSFVSVLLFILAVFAAALLPTVYSWQYYRDAFAGVRLSGQIFRERGFSRRFF